MGALLQLRAFSALRFGLFPVLSPTANVIDFSCCLPLAIYSAVNTTLRQLRFKKIKLINNLAQQQHFTATK